MLAHRRSDPAIGGRMVRRFPRPTRAMAAAPAIPPAPKAPAILPAANAPSGQLMQPACDLASALPSLRSVGCCDAPADGSAPPAECSDEVLAPLTTLVAASGGLFSAEVCSSSGPAHAAPLVSSLNWAASLSSDEDSDEELVPRSPLATSRAGAVQGTTDMHEDGMVPQKMSTSLPATSSVSPCSGISASAAALRADEDWEPVGRGRRFARGAPPVSSSSLHKEGLERSLEFKRWARGRCFRCLEHGHQVSTCNNPFRCIRCRRPGHRERFCRARSPAARSCSPVAPCQRNRSPSAQPCHPSLTRSWAEVVGHSSLRVALPPRSSSGCCKDSFASANLDPAFQSLFALLRSELHQLVADRIEEVSRPLREELATVKLLFARASSSLEHADLCASGEITGHESVVVDDDNVVVEIASKVGDEAIVGMACVESSVVGEECIFGCFSPRDMSCPSLQPDVAVASECENIDGFIAPVMEIMPELHELCVEPSAPMSMVHLQVDSLGTTTVASAPTPMEPSLCEKVSEGGLLVGNSEALFARELCGLLVSLEAAIPGSSKKIACLLAEKTSGGKIHKVKEYLRSRSRSTKSGVTKKEAATA